jgi:cell division protein ZapA
MSEVALSIGGRTYRVACAPGEEDRVTRLGNVVSDKLAAMGNLGGHEAQNLLFAALLLADEVHEGRDAVSKAGEDVAAARRDTEAAATLRDRIAELESEIVRLKGAERDAAGERNAAAARMEQMSAQLAESRTAETNLRRDLDIAARQRAEAGARGGEAPVEELTPALERLAEMLEDCADKLESGRPSA